MGEIVYNWCMEIHRGKQMKEFPVYKTVSVSSLIPYARNSRTHSDSQVGQIAASIKEFGFLNPIIVDGGNGIIAGHGRILAMQKMGLAEVPVIDASHLTDVQRRAYIIADNKLAMNAEWDSEMLRVELDALGVDGFDIELTGFSLDEIANLQIEEVPEGLTDEDAVPEAPDKPLTVEGDVWVLGSHRLHCGDSTRIDAVEKLMDGHKADMVFTDPPYGISIVGKAGSVGGEKLAKVGVYAKVAGDASTDVAVSAIHIIKTLGAKVEVIWGGNYYSSHLKDSSCWIVWDKDNTGNFADAELAWTNQETAVRIFKHTWNGMIKESERGEKRVHPTQKPVALAEWCIKEYGCECNTVLDLFGGSGFTLMACERIKKDSYTMELSTAYCDVIIKRFQEYTGKEAVLESTGETYNSKISA